MKKRFFPMLFLLLLALILPFSLGTLEAEAAAKEQRGFHESHRRQNHSHYIRRNHMQQNKRNHPQHSREHLGR